MRTLLLLVFLSTLIQAQHLGIGVKGGAVFTDTFTNIPVSNVRTDESKRYTVGPMVELELPKGFGMEFDALYRRIGFTDVSNVAGPSVVRERDHSWEFPILGKYTLRRWASQPFVSSGYSFRSVSGAYSGTYEQHVVLPVGPVQRFDGKTSYEGTGGFVLGGGVEFHVSRIRIAPELRYTRWNGVFADSGPSGLFRSSTQNQVELLFGFSWR